MSVKLAIIGTGGMANCHVDAFKKIEGCTVSACCDVNQKRVEEFAQRHHIKSVYTDYRKLLRQEKIDAVSVVTSDVAHAEISIAAFNAGKNVLCEKPLSTNLKDARKMLAAAKKAGTINMVNFSYHCSSALRYGAALVQAGRLGRLRQVEASYLQSWVARAWPKDLANCWRLCKQLGGTGVWGDIGCHILDFATTIAGDIVKLSCLFKTHKFKELRNNRIGKINLDANSAAVVIAEFKSGAVGVIHVTNWAVGHSNTLKLRVYGDRGAVEIDLDCSWTELKTIFGDPGTGAWGPQNWETVKCEPVVDNFHRFISSIRTGKQDSPTFVDAYKIQQYLTAGFISATTGGKPVLISQVK